MDEIRSRVYVGIKWGLQAPTVLLAVRYYLRPMDHIQVIREVFAREMMLEEAVGVARQWRDELNVRKYFCDPSQERFIKILRKQRIWAVPVDGREVNLAINILRKRTENYQRNMKLLISGNKIEPGRGALYHVLREGLSGGISYDPAPGITPHTPPRTEDFVCPNLMSEFKKFRGKEQKANRRFDDKPLEVDNYAICALHYILLGLATEVTPQVRWLS